MRRKIVNGDNSQKIENEISNFISHLINQVPVASNKYNILFYTPISIEPIILYNGTFMEVTNFLNKYYEDGTVDVESYDNWFNRQIRERSATDKI